MIVTEHYPKALGKTCQELQIQNAALIAEKTKFSMFIPKVESYLVENDIRSVILVGIESHICILQTALDLMENGFKVYVLSDGISSINKAEIPIAVARLRQGGAVITTSESILFELLESANHPNFKSISELVKSTRQTSVAALELADI